MPNAMARLIRERRQDLGLTQEQLANRIGGGARQSEVSRLEQGRVALPRRLRMERIAAALEVPLGELLLSSGWVGAEVIDDLSAAGPGESGEEDGQEFQQSIEDLQARNANLQANVDLLQHANDRLRDRGVERATQLRTAEAIVEQMRSILNALPDAVVVVNHLGVVVTENRAYAIFSTTHTDGPTLLYLSGGAIPEAEFPLERASRGERFTMEFRVKGDVARTVYWATGQPVSTVHGGRVGVVTIRGGDAALS
jgi:transcriptional regulator with XRE-family HTH domain